MEYCFYLDWAGWSPEVWAAWAQAILSALAIIVAARMATNQERRARRSRVDGYVAIITDVYDESINSHEMFANLVGFHAPPGGLEKWQELCKLLSAIPFHEVPEYRLYTAVRGSLDIAKQIRDTYIATSDPGSKISEEDVEFMLDARNEITRICDESVSVSNDLATPSLKQRWKYWRFKARSKQRALKAERPQQ